MDLSNNQLTFSFSIERILAMPTPAVNRGSSCKDTFSNNYHLHFLNNNFASNSFTTRDNINNDDISNNRYQVNDAFNSIAISTFAENEDFVRYNSLQANAQLYPSMASIQEALTLPIEFSPSTVSPVNQLTHQYRQSQLIVTETSGSNHLQCHLQEQTPASTMRREEQQSLDQSEQFNFSSLEPFYKSTNYLEPGIFNSINTATSSNMEVNGEKSGGSEKSYLFAHQRHSPISTSSLRDKVAIQSGHPCSSLERQLHYFKRPNAAGSGTRGKHLLKQLTNPSSCDSIETAQYKKVKEEQVDDSRTKNSQFNRRLQHSPSAGASSSSKGRRFSRAVFTESQRIGLENAFQASQYVQKGCRTRLAESLGLTELQVKVWFQNRRMKWRSSKEHQSFSQIILSGSTSSQFNKKLGTTSDV